jgi:hypothetical protein
MKKLSSLHLGQTIIIGSTFNLLDQIKTKYLKHGKDIKFRDGIAHGQGTEFISLVDRGTKGSDLVLILQDDRGDVSDFGLNEVKEDVLKKVLKALSSVTGDTFFSDTKGTEVGAKDLRRMSDIQFKANGDEAKIEQLVKNMANSIKEKDKAIRRAKAAEEVFKGELGKKMAKIFMNKAKEL